MWAQTGSHLDPPHTSPVTEVLSARNTTQVTGPFNFGPRWVSLENFNIIPPISSIPPQLQIQPSFQMPLEPRAYRSSRSRQRIRGAQRRPPYRVSGFNERIYRRTLLPEWTEAESLQLRVSSDSSDNEIRHFRILVKRQDRVPCVCSHCNVTITQYGTNSDTILPSGESQIPSSTQWVRTLDSEPICRLQGSSLLTTNYITDTDDNRFLPESRTDIEPPLLLDSMIDRQSSSDPISVTVISNSVEAVSPVSSNCSSVSELDNNQNPFHFSSHCNEQQNMRIYEKSDPEFSNHDRTTEKFTVPPLSHSTSNSLLISKYQSNALTMPVIPISSIRVRQVANRVIKHARHNKTPNESSMFCPNCGLFPILPVTGQCGHTRCTKCIQNHGPCPCGTQAPKKLHVNTLIQDLIRKLFPDGVSARIAAKTSNTQRKSLHIFNYRLFSRLSPGDSDGRQTRGPVQTSVTRAPMIDIPPRTPMSPQTRLEHAQELVAAGRHLEAVPHLARVAASSEPLARISRSLLAQSIAMVARGRDPRRLTRALYRAVRLQAAATWLKPTDLECVLCYQTYTEPVTTPCGHTYCRTCIERSMDYKKSCALCLRPLHDFSLAATRETVFICAALASIDAVNPPIPLEPDVIPIFVCTVAFPTIPCPLFIFDPRYWVMLRRILESGSRKFGMVAYERDRSYSDYGTVLEICDCVHLEDGRSILSTVGVSRFQVIERDVRDGCYVARILPLNDIAPTDELLIWNLRLVAMQISYKALLWLSRVNKSVLDKIETAFGELPSFNHYEGEWWESADGPPWLWWLIAILPLRSEIKVLILSTNSLLKRMTAVSRTLVAIDHLALTATSSPCVIRNALTEEWLQRSA